MIIVRITSGLGNQMFQYAFYTLLKKTYSDTEVLCDTYWFNSNHENRKYELESVFSGVMGSEFEIQKAPLGKVVGLSGRLPNLFNGSLGKFFNEIRRYINRLLKNGLLKRRLPYIIDELEGNISGKDQIWPDGSVTNPLFDKLMSLDTKNDYYISGYYISEKYYSRVYEDIRKKFIFPELKEKHNIEYSEDMKRTDSVSIHVRRGDYLSDLYKDTFIVLGREYYEEAVKRIIKEIEEICDREGRKPNIKFFIFSDDPDFVKSEFDWIGNKTIVTGNSGSNSFRDMQLMGLCKHNIIANSTFSQWGALLNQNEGHITIYPKVYMKNEDNELKTLPGWIRI